MSNVVPYHMFQSGFIPGVEGLWPAGITVYVDEDTREVVDRAYIEQQPDNPQPLVEAPAGEALPAQPADQPVIEEN